MLCKCKCLKHKLQFGVSFLKYLYKYPLTTSSLCVLWHVEQGEAFRMMVKILLGTLQSVFEHLDASPNPSSNSSFQLMCSVLLWSPPCTWEAYTEFWAPSLRPLLQNWKNLRVSALSLLLSFSLSNTVKVTLLKKKQF